MGTTAIVQAGTLAGAGSDPMLVQGWPLSEMRVVVDGRELSQAEKLQYVTPSVGGRYELFVPGSDVKMARYSDSIMWADVGWEPHPQYGFIERKVDQGGGWLLRLAPWAPNTPETRIVLTALTAGEDPAAQAAVVNQLAPGGSGGGVNILSDGTTSGLSADQQARADGIRNEVMEIVTNPGIFAPPPPPPPPVAVAVPVPVSNAAAPGVSGSGGGGGSSGVGPGNNPGAGGGAQLQDGGDASGLPLWLKALIGLGVGWLLWRA